MNRKRAGAHIAFALSAVMLAAALLCPAAAGASETQAPLKVGYIDYHGFISQNEAGGYTGYAVEYLNKISEYTGFSYEYVYGSWPDLMEQLKNGEIDLLCNAQYTDARAEAYDYSRFPLGYTQGLLYALPDNETLGYEDFREFNDLTVGAVKDSATTPLFLQYEEKNGFSCRIVDYGSEAEMIAALEGGAIDAMLSENMASLTGYLLLAEYSAGPYYIISYKGFPYMDEIDAALQEIKTSVDFEPELYHKYYSESAARNSLRLTAAEREYIAEENVINVGLMQERPPFSLYDAATGEFTGICPDVLESISEATGLRFNYVPMELTKTTPQLLATGGYDVICGVERDNFVTSEEFVPTAAFMESAVVPVGRAGESLDMGGHLKVAVSVSFQALAKKLASDYPNMEVIGFDTSEQCLDAVVAGDVDMFIQNTHLLGQLLQRPKYDNLEILPIEIMEEHTSMVMGRGSNLTLLSILNKSIATLDDTMLSTSLIEHTFATQYTYTAMDYLAKLWLPITIILLLVAVCFALMLRVALVRKRSEAALQKKNSQLSDAVAQAEYANAAKGQFPSRMSHEIRTPMNAIVGLTAIAKQHEQEPERVEECLDRIDTSSKVLLNIINDVLDMSAIESGKLKVANERFDIKQVLAGISTIYCPQCQAKGVRFDMQIDIENEALVGDSLRVNQILLNLVSNAYKFTESGGCIRVHVKETARKDDMAFIRFTVADTGCGMGEEMLDRLFHPFEQESADTAKTHGGSGLGLSIAKNLVDMMHGAIRAESAKGVGTTFTVDIPFGVAERPLEEGGQALLPVRVAAQRTDGGIQAEGEAPESFDFSGHRVLLAEDQELNAEIATELLGMVKLQVDHAEDGQEAVDMFSAAPPDTYDLILMDVQMPVMDGYAAANAIRALPRPDAASIPIFAMTANAFTEDVAAALSAGMNGHIAKPIDTDKLYATIDKVIPRQPSA